MSSIDPVAQPAVLPTINPRPGVFKLRQRNVSMVPNLACKLPAQATNAMNCSIPPRAPELTKDKSSQYLQNFARRFSLRQQLDSENARENRPRVSMLNKWRRRRSSLAVDCEGQPPCKMMSPPAVSHSPLIDKGSNGEANKLKSVFKEMRRRSIVFSQTRRTSTPFVRDRPPHRASIQTGPPACLRKPIAMRNRNSMIPTSVSDNEVHRSSPISADKIVRTNSKSSASTRTQPIRVTVTPYQTSLRVDDVQSIDSADDHSSCSSDEITNFFSTAQKPDYCPSFSVDYRHKQELAAGCAIFNRNPQDGLCYLKSRGVIDDSPRSVAAFLFNRTDLCRQAIGEFFGMIGDGKSDEILREFLHLIDMDGLELDEAIRRMLSYFHPAGESQKISHLLHTFQEVYIEKNPTSVDSIFRSKETVEVLAYSILMLHTDLHNPNLKRFGTRMSQESFLLNNRGIDAGGDLPSSLLKGIYHRVAKHEFKTLPDSLEVLRRLDSMLVGVQKTESIVQRQRTFIGWVAAQELDDIPTRSNTNRKRWRHVLVFNDFVMLVKPVAGTSSSSTPIWNSNDNADAIYRSELDDGTSYSTEPPTRGAYHLRMTVPIDDIRILVFKSQRCRNGIRFCNKDGPLVNLLLPSSQARSTLLAWTHAAYVQHTEMYAYYQTKQNHQTDK